MSLTTRSLTASTSLASRLAMSWSNARILMVTSPPGSEIDAYRYLPESVWAFPTPAELAGELEAAGLSVLEQRPFLGGAVVLHVAERPDP